MFAPLGEIIRNGIAQTTPSGLFFAIGEQLSVVRPSIVPHHGMESHGQSTP